MPLVHDPELAKFARFLDSNRRTYPRGSAARSRMLHSFAEGRKRNPRLRAVHVFAEADTATTTMPMDDDVGPSREELLAAVKAALPTLPDSWAQDLTDAQLREFVASLPTVRSDGMGGAADVAEFADLSRTDLVAALVEMGQDADELEAMPDEELAALYQELLADQEVRGEAEAALDQPAVAFCEKHGASRAYTADFVKRFAELRKRKGMKKALSILQ